MSDLPGIKIVPCRVGKPQGLVKCWIVYDGPTALVVDTGQDADDAAAIGRALSDLDRSLAGLSACILTHRHGDHVGGLPSLVAGASIPVLAHPADRERIEVATGVAVQDLRPGPLSWLPDVEVIPMPGHTPGTVSLCWHSRGILIAGDAVFSAGRHLMCPPDYLCDDPARARQSLAELVARDFPLQAILVAHGEDVFEGGRARLQRTQAIRRDNNA